ncbi:MAG TPA: HEAT repeat domain-containing protein, partial [Candidatus Binatia bacterium]|nr:HEAT repeat domain-containing protein [Candidatus Binatia bacterium]
MKVNCDSGAISESYASSTTDLIDVITTWPVGMPVRPMEKLLGIGETAITLIAEGLSRWRDDKSRDLLWLVVVLGELRHPAAIEPLVNQLRQITVDVFATAAAEALAKIGSPAVPALVDATTAPDPYFRLYTYATLGWIEDEKAYAALINGLARDYELGHVLANALAEQG